MSRSDGVAGATKYRLTRAQRACLTNTVIDTDLGGRRYIVTLTEQTRCGLLALGLIEYSGGHDFLSHGHKVMRLTAAGEEQRRLHGGD